MWITTDSELCKLKPMMGWKTPIIVKAKNMVLEGKDKDRTGIIHKPAFKDFQAKGSVVIHDIEEDEPLKELLSKVCTGVIDVLVDE